MSKQGNSTEPPKRSPHRAGGFVRADLKAYLDGELSPLRRWIVRGHLTYCAACREEVTWLQRLGKNMRNLEAARPNPELRKRILDTLPAMEPVEAHPLRPSPADSTGLFHRPAFRLALSGGMLALLVVGAIAIPRLRHPAPSHAALVKIPSPQPGPSGNSPTGIAQSGAPSGTSPGATTPDSHSIPKRDPFNGIDFPHDPWSLAADHAVKEEDAHRARVAAQELKRDWSHAVSVAQHMPQTLGKSGEVSYVPVRVEVSDTARAQKNLEHWAQKSGSIVSSATTTGSAVTMVFRIAPTQSAGMLTELKHLGAVAMMKPTGGEEIPSVASVRPAVPVEGAPGYVTGAPSAVAGKTDPGSIQSVPNKMAVDTINGQARKNAPAKASKSSVLITVAVKLLQTTTSAD